MIMTASLLNLRFCGKLRLDGGKVRVVSVLELDSRLVYFMTINLYHQWNRRGGENGISSGTGHHSWIPYSIKDSLKQRMI